MSDSLNPPLSVLTKLGSIAVHVEEMLSPNGHHFDRLALESLMSDPEVEDWMKDMRKMALLPVKR